MALAYEGAAVYSVELIDENSRRSSKEFVIPASAWSPVTGLWADLVTIVNGIATALDAVTDALILSAFITIKQVDDTLTVGPAGSDLTDAAAIVCNLSTVGKKTTYILPAPVIGVFSGATGKNRNVVDGLDVGLLALLEKFTLTDGVADISDGERLADTNIVVGGKRISRKLKAPTV